MIQTPAQFNPRYVHDKERKSLLDRAALLAEIDETAYMLRLRIPDSALADPPKMRRTRVRVAGDHCVVVTMDHWYISYDGPSLRPPLWRRVVLMESQWLPGHLWIREDGELVVSMLYNDKRRSVSRPVKHDELSDEDVKKLRGELVRIRKAILQPA